MPSVDNGASTAAEQFEKLKPVIAEIGNELMATLERSRRAHVHLLHESDRDVQTFALVCACLLPIVALAKFAGGPPSIVAQSLPTLFEIMADATNINPVRA